MRGRRLLTVTVVAFVLLAGGVGWLLVRLAGRQCSMSESDRVVLVERLEPARIEPLLERVLGGGDGAHPLRIAAPTERRDFALDQGPQRVCASGAALRSSARGDVNLLVRIYDSGEAAQANAKSNLAVPISVADDRGVSSGATCTRPGSDGCREQGAQGIVGPVSVVVLSRSLTPSEVDAIATELAAGLAELTT